MLDAFVRRREVPPELVRDLRFSRHALLDRLVRCVRMTVPARVYYDRARLAGSDDVRDAITSGALRALDACARWYVGPDGRAFCAGDASPPLRILGLASDPAARDRARGRVIAHVGPIFAMGGYPEDARNPRLLLVRSPRNALFLHMPSADLAHFAGQPRAALRAALAGDAELVLRAAAAEAARLGHKLWLKMPPLGMPEIYEAPDGSTHAGLVGAARDALGAALEALEAAAPEVLAEIAVLECPDFSPAGEFAPPAGAAWARRVHVGQRDLLDFGVGDLGPLFPAVAVFGDPWAIPGGGHNRLEAAVADNTALRRFACWLSNPSLLDDATHVGLACADSPEEDAPSD